MRQSNHKMSYHLPVIPRLDRGIPLEQRPTQAGNVFVIILLGVFLFGSLMYMFSRNAQQGTGNLTKQQASIAAQEILNYARLVEGAVDRVRRNGCSETEISFENDVVAGYEHTPPARDECKVFDDAGGKVSYSEVSENFIDNSFQSKTGDVLRPWKEYRYTGHCSITEVGTNCSTSSCKELALNIHYINKEICLEINKNMNIAAVSGDAPVESISSPPGGMACAVFIGDFADTPNGVDSGVPTAPTACLKVAESGNDYYFFYHVLLAR